jgi:hypothetical protein
MASLAWDTLLTLQEMVRQQREVIAKTGATLKELDLE